MDLGGRQSPHLSWHIFKSGQQSHHTSMEMGCRPHRGTSIYFSNRSWLLQELLLAPIEVWDATKTCLEAVIIHVLYSGINTICTQKIKFSIHQVDHFWSNLHHQYEHQPNLHTSVVCYIQLYVQCFFQTGILGDQPNFLSDLSWIALNRERN